MKVTYIKHSGFEMEWEHCIWIFDYWKGTLSDLDPTKKVIVFGSHSHHDHFNPDIAKLLEQHPKVEYVLSDDIRFRDKHKITRLAPHESYQMQDGMGNAIEIKTLESTDCGVAFVVRYQGKTIYHAGDLNWWIWKGEDEQEQQVMTEAFQKEMKYLKEIAPDIDIAFIPVDPRQEEWYYKGISYLMEQVDVRTVFPMHVWNRYSVIEQLKGSKEATSYTDKIMLIRQAGQSFDVEL